MGSEGYRRANSALSGSGFTTEDEDGDLLSVKGRSRANSLKSRSRANSLKTPARSRANSRSANSKSPLGSILELADDEDVELGNPNLSCDRLAMFLIRARVPFTERSLSAMLSSDTESSTAAEGSVPDYVASARQAYLADTGNRKLLFAYNKALNRAKGESEAGSDCQSELGKEDTDKELAGSDSSEQLSSSAVAVAQPALASVLDATSSGGGVSDEMHTVEQEANALDLLLAEVECVTSDEGSEVTSSSGSDSSGRRRRRKVKSDAVLAPKDTLYNLLEAAHDGEDVGAMADAVLCSESSS